MTQTLVQWHNILKVDKPYLYHGLKLGHPIA